jgi:hypothetical protein
VRHEAVPAREVDHAPAAKSPSGSARHLPRFEELSAGETLRLAEDAADVMQERRAGEASQVASGELRPARGIERRELWRFGLRLRHRRRTVP